MRSRVSAGRNHAAVGSPQQTARLGDEARLRATASPVPIGGSPERRLGRRASSSATDLAGLVGPDSTSPGAEYEAPGCRGSRGARGLKRSRRRPGSREVRHAPRPGGGSNSGRGSFRSRGVQNLASTEAKSSCCSSSAHLDQQGARPAGLSRTPPRTSRREYREAPSRLPIHFPWRRVRHGVTVRETASSSPRYSSPWWKNQLRFAGSRSPPSSISPSRWMYSPSFADSSW